MTSRRRSYFLAASVGAGKTLAALLAFLRSDCDLLIVLTPRTGIRTAWQDDAQRLGVKLEDVISGARFDGDRRRLPHGYVLTAQMLHSVANDLKKLCSNARVMVVVDEGHHLTEGGTWNKSAVAGLDRAAFWLSISGTPERGDDRRIANLQYERQGQARVAKAAPDFVQSYEAAMQDGLVPPIIIRFLGGYIEQKNPNGTRAIYDFADRDYRERTGRVNEQRIRERLRKAAIESLDYQRSALTRAVHQLHDYRRDGQPWGGLVVCRTVKQAEALHAILHDQMREPSLLLVSDADTEEGVARFRTDLSLRWIVAITKVSEGISIPRLRVAVMLSNVTAKPTLEQIRGRLARLMPGVAPFDQEAMFFLLADPRCIAFARTSNEMMLHSVPWLAPPDEGEDPEQHAARMAEARRRHLDHPEADGGIDARDHIQRMRERLGDEAQYEPIDLGGHVLEARLQMDGAVIGEEYLDEDGFLDLREAMVPIIGVFTAMRAEGSFLAALHALRAGDLS